MCLRSSDPFYIVSYNIKWVTTSWAYSSLSAFKSYKKGGKLQETVFPRSLDPFYIVNIVKLVKKTLGHSVWTLS